MAFTVVRAGLLAVFLGVCAARNGFVKDQSTTRIPFPAGVPPRKPYSDIPIGHLRPLGYQRLPDSTVGEAKKMPKPRDFYLIYIKHLTPVVFRQTLNNVPAVTTWADDSYLKNTYGDLDVEVVVKKERAKDVPLKMTFNKFLREYHYEDWYLSTVTPYEMLHELALPDCLKCGMKKFLEEAEVWMSSGGTASLLHSHADHSLHCVLAGRKDFILIQPQHKDKLAFHANSAYPEAGSSEIDMDRVNMFKYKSVAEVPWSWSTLWSGDCIYIPAGHLLQVRSHGRSISSTIHWFPTPKVSFRKCDANKMATFLPLSESRFTWTYIGGRKQLSVQNMTPRRMKRHLLLLMRYDQFLSFERFQSFYDEVMREVKGHSDANFQWDILTGGGKMIVSRKDITDATREVLLNLAYIFNTATHRQIIKHDEL